LCAIDERVANLRGVFERLGFGMRPRALFDRSGVLSINSMTRQFGPIS